MKSILVAMLCCVLFSVDLIAQVDSSHLKTTELSLSGGYALPYLPENFHDQWKNGWYAGAGGGITLIPGTLGYASILLTVDVSRMAFDYQKYRDAALPEVITTSRNPVWMASGMLNFRGTITALSSFFQPYLFAGIGFNHVSQGDIEVEGAVRDTIKGESKGAFAWTAGAGFDVPVNDQIGVFFQARSTLAVTDPQWQYFSLGGGIRYRIRH